MSEPSERAPSEEPEAQEEGSTARGEEARPRKKRRKKKRALPEDAPTFAHAFPADPELDALVAAFERGDYARVRAEAPRLAQRTQSDAIRRAAEELVQRTRPDPLAVYLLLLACALLVFLAAWYWMHRLGGS
jgi:hypothetical protein